MSPNSFSPNYPLYIVSGGPPGESFDHTRVLILVTIHVVCYNRHGIRQAAFDSMDSRLYCQARSPWDCI
jgi:hypothetical protein